jgi:phosphoribosylanthranilate isomerase
MRCKLKICGVTQASDALQLAEMGVDAIGVNFWNGSKRYISPENAQPFLEVIKGKILRVGVFVNEDFERVKEIYEAGLIDVAQLHGDESACYYEAMIKHKIDFIQVIRVRTEDTSLEIPTLFSKKILLDTFVPNYGGEGLLFNWNLAAKFITDHPDKEIILAGGITPKNVAQAILINPYMIDVASGVEILPGIKSMSLVKELLSKR